MKRKNKYIVSLLLWFIITGNLMGQDFHLSQYDASPLYLNPAMTGMFNGKYRIHGHYRNQWSSVTTPFTTSSISFDMPYNKLGFGGIILNNRAGEGNYNVLKAVGSLGYCNHMDSAGFHNISAGLQVGLIHKSINIDKLIFHNQYTYTNSGGFDPDLPTGENLANTSLIIPEFTASLLYFYSNSSAKINPFIGFTVFHLTEPNETFYSNENNLPRRFVTHLGTKLNLSDKIQVSPMLLYMSQGNVSEIDLSFVANFLLVDHDAWIFFGPTYRLFKFNHFTSNDALVFLGGLKYGNFTYRLSYDINISNLNSISKGRGGFELSITYLISNMQFPPIACPRL